MGFKSSKQRGGFFEKLKEKGISPQKSAPGSISTSFSAPKISPTIAPTANPGIIPPLPGLPKAPKFGRIKKLLKTPRFE